MMMLARLRLPPSRVAARLFFKASTPLLGGEDLKREPSIYDIKKAFADKCFTIFDVDGNGGTVKASELRRERWTQRSGTRSCYEYIDRS